MKARPCFVLFAVCAMLACSGCHSAPAAPERPASPPRPAMQPAPATPIDQKRQELGGKTWDPQWDVLVEQALPTDMLSPTAAHAVRLYCPRFAEETSAEKRAFWAYTFQALAAAEAGLNPTSDVHHLAAAVNRVDPATGARTRQEGLLQLTYQDADRYGCDFDYKSDRTLPAHDPERTILQPGRNLGCGIRIMQNQIITQHEPLVTRHSYWATLQPGTFSYRVFARQMANVPAACGRHVRRRRHRRG